MDFKRVLVQEGNPVNITQGLYVPTCRVKCSQKYPLHPMCGLGRSFVADRGETDSPLCIELQMQVQTSEHCDIITVCLTHIHPYILGLY